MDENEGDRIMNMKPQSAKREEDVRSIVLLGGSEWGFYVLESVVGVLERNNPFST